MIGGVTLGLQSAGVRTHGHAAFVATGVCEGAVPVRRALRPPAAGVRVTQRARQAFTAGPVADCDTARVRSAGLEGARVLALTVDARLSRWTIRVGPAAELVAENVRVSSHAIATGADLAMSDHAAHGVAGTDVRVECARVLTPLIDAGLSQRAVVVLLALWLDSGHHDRRLGPLPTLHVRVAFQRRRARALRPVVVDVADRPHAAAAQTGIDAVQVDAGQRVGAVRVGRTLGLALDVRRAEQAGRARADRCGAANLTAGAAAARRRVARVPRRTYGDDTQRSLVEFSTQHL